MDLTLRHLRIVTNPTGLATPIRSVKKTFTSDFVKITFTRMAPFEVDQAVKVLFDRFSDPSRSALEGLLFAAGIHEYLEQVMPVLAKVAREEEGHTWADVGEVLQITRQAAYQRLGKPFLYVDGTGGYQVVDPSSKAYLESLRQARESLADEPGREDDVRLIDNFLAQSSVGASGQASSVVPVEVEVEVPAGARAATKGAAKRTSARAVSAQHKRL
jgi:hypothetical protein